jgi:molybdopterin-guanine dinucleotide biosynthesis protein A/formate dehydrogenase assembly factor FdhD
MNGPVVEEAVVQLVQSDDVLFEWRCTPHDLHALVAGRLYCEGLIRNASIVDDLKIEVIDDVITISLEAPLEAVREPSARAANAPIPDAAAFADMYRALFNRIDALHEGGGMHAAALVRDGAIVFQAEDVGRHNTVDKVIGLALLAEAAIEEYGLLITARVSGAIARKAARAGVAWLASRSIPTTLALREAEAAGLRIVGRAGKYVYPSDRVPQSTISQPPILGVVMAGGRNTRYGGLKAFAQVDGKAIVERVIAALMRVTTDVVVIANDAEAYASLGLPIRPDAVAAGGAVAGLLTALRWGAEKGATGVLVVACDMPFASGALLEQIADTAAASGADVVAPESGSRRGIEPLFAYYSTRCIPAIEAAIARGDLRMIGFHDDVRVVPIGSGDVHGYGDPSILFMNVNTPDELAKACAVAEAAAP